MTDESHDVLSRRAALRGAAAVGGALVWSVPVVTAMASPSAAAGSAPPGPPTTTSESTPPESTSTESTPPESTPPESSPETSVEATKTGSAPTPVQTPGGGSGTPPTEVLGTKLPHTGPALPVVPSVTIGGAMVGTGAVLMHLAKNPPPQPARLPVDEVDSPG